MEKIFGDVTNSLKSVMEHAAKVVVGQTSTLKQVILALLCDANVLLEGYPGLAKTLSVRTLAQLMELKFSRIQGTPDLMPSDITGTYVLEEKDGKRDFKFQPGPVFANIVLFDEINRAAPKTQSSLLEAMQEKQVTVGNKTFKLDKPFFVLATMNPIEMEGTFQLPEAQSDRFLFKIKTDYPSFEEEIEIVSRYTDILKDPELKPIVTKEQLLKMQDLVRKIPVANDIKKFAVELVTKSRVSKELIEYGASPRASIGLILAAKANALFEGRSYVTKDDIKEASFPVLRHRIILNFEAERNNFNEDDVIKYLLK